MTMSCPNEMRSFVVNECWIDGSVSENSRLKPLITLLAIPANSATATIVTIQSVAQPVESVSSPDEDAIDSEEAGGLPRP